MFEHLQQKVTLIFLLLSKIAKIHAWNKPKSYTTALISMQIFSAIK